MPIAKIESGRVVQIDRTTDLAPAGWIVCAADIACGMAFDGSNFSVPALSARDVARAEIVRLESTITARRAREAILTDAGRAWLANVEGLIAIERAKL
jgi:hypothetical protein